MWIILTFDLPNENSALQKAYRVFRKYILKYGFTALQKSVYIKYCSSSAHKKTLINKISKNLPELGDIAIFSISDDAFSKQYFFHDNIKIPSPEKPKQFLIFDDDFF